MITNYPWISELLKDRLATSGFVIIVLLCLVGLFAPYIAPDSGAQMSVNVSKRLMPPSKEHVFGTDQMGRDVLSRIILGTRITIIVATSTIIGALLVGVPLGLVAGYFEGWVGGVLMRICDVILALPQIVLALALAAALGPSMRNAILAITITYWPWWSRVVYAETLSAKRSVFIEASKALGVGKVRIILLHVLPNILSPIIVRSTIGMGGAIMTAATLGYLGVGAQPPTPEWGLAVAESREYLPRAWWFATFPGLSIFTVVLAFNLFGDGLRDVLDPRLRISGK